MVYFYIRKTMRFLSNLFKQQCSGKRRVGPYNSLEWCQKRAFHEGVCVSHQGMEF